jgi:ribosomal protein L40E
MESESELSSKTEFIPIKEQQAEEFNCPVCYTDGSESGLVNPAKCNHKICLECYTNIATRAQSPSCPMCRKAYLNTTTPPPSLSNSPTNQQQQQQQSQQQQRLLTPHLNSDVMSLLIHNELPQYSFRNVILNTQTDVERAHIVIDLLNSAQ